MDMNWWMNASAWVIPVVLAVTMHEAAHGWMAMRFGDDTAQRQGRVTFNPLKHVDRVGTVLLPSLLLLMQSNFIFGYAKPVPVYFNGLKPQRLGMIMVAFAGPGINLLLALLSALLLHIDQFVSPEEAPWVFANLYRSLMINCVLAVFNMLPVPPLDGGRIMFALLSGKLRQWYHKIEPYGMFLVIGVLFIPGLLGYHQTLQIVSEPTFWLVEQLLRLTVNTN